MSNTMTGISKEQIQELIRGYVSETLEEMEDIKLANTRPIPIEKVWGDADVASDLREEYVDKLTRCDYTPILHIADSMLKGSDIELDKGSKDYRKLCQETFKAVIELLKVQERHAHGDYNATVPAQYLMPPAPVATYEQTLQNTKSKPSVKLSQVIEEHMQENIRAGNWAKSTISEYKNMSKLLIRFLGDTPVDQIGYDTGRLFKTAISSMPPRLNSLPKYKSLTMEDVSKLDVAKKASVSTVNKYLDYTSGVFTFAKRNHYTDIHPLEGLRIKQRRKANDQKAPFDSDDLIKIFHSDYYKNDKAFAPHVFWIPILALYTGARVGELAQLKISSLKKEDGVWYLDITGELKTEHSERTIPLHPFIIDELKFPEFVSRQEGHEDDRIFSSLKPVNGKWGHAMTNWYTRRKKEFNLKPDKRGRGKSFHSFRHAFATYMKHKSIDKHMLKETIGHADKDMTYGRYGDRYPVKVLYENVILKLDYGIDLEHLKSSKYAG